MVAKRLTTYEFQRAVMLARGWKYGVNRFYTGATECHLMCPDDPLFAKGDYDLLETPPRGFTVHEDGSEYTYPFWRVDEFFAIDLLSKMHEGGVEWLLSASQKLTCPHECRLFIFGDDKDAPEKRFIARAPTIELAVCQAWYEWKTGIRVEVTDAA